MTSAKYRIYVRLKNGDQVGGRELYKGPPPASGTELEVPLLRGGTVKARIGSSHTEERSGFAGTLVTEIIYADEGARRLAMTECMSHFSTGHCAGSRRRRIAVIA